MGHLMRNRIQLRTGVNTNTLDNPGIYAVDNPTNGPGSSQYLIEVMVATDGVDRFVVQRSTDLADGSKKERIYNGSSWGTWTRNAIQTEITFIRHSGTPSQGSSSAAGFNFPGAALSASVYSLYGSVGRGQRLIYARFFTAWNPNTADTDNTSIRLVHFESGPSNITNITTFTRNTLTTPTTDAAEVTSNLQALLALGVDTKFLGIQTQGTGAEGPLIYAAWIECVWET